MRLTYIFLLLGYWAQAQITVTDASFIKAGDTLRLLTALEPAGVVLGESGENKIWDFSSVGYDEVTKTIIRPASEGADFQAFPQATLMTSTEGGDVYIQVTASEMRVLGVSGTQGIPLTQNVLPRYTPPLVEQRAPMNFFDVQTADINLGTSFPADFLPPELLDLFPFKPDSLRFSQVGTRLDVVDGWGKVIIPGGEFDVLRERRRSIVNTKIEAFIGFGWIDLSSIFPLPGVGADTTQQYYYFAEGEPGPVAIVEVDPSDFDIVLSVQYRNLGIVSTFQPTPLEVTLFKGPNPATHNMRFEIGAEFGRASVEIFSISGQVVYRQDGLSGMVELPLPVLASGTYIYRVMAADRWLESGPVVIQY